MRMPGINSGTGDVSTDPSPDTDTTGSDGTDSTTSGGDDDGADNDTAPSVGNDVAYNATPVARAAETLTGYVTVTAEVAVVQEPGPETTKAILVDSSGVIDFMTWDSEG